MRGHSMRTHSLRNHSLRTFAAAVLAASLASAPARGGEAIPDGTYLLMTPTGVPDEFGPNVLMTVSGPELLVRSDPPEVFCGVGCEGASSGFALEATLSGGAIGLSDPAFIAPDGTPAPENAGTRALHDALAAALDGGTAELSRTVLTVASPEATLHFRATTPERAAEGYGVDAYFSYMMGGAPGMFGRCLTGRLLAADAALGSTPDGHVLAAAAPVLAEIIRAQDESNLMYRRATLQGGFDPMRDKLPEAEDLSWRSQYLSEMVAFELNNPGRTLTGPDDIRTEFFYNMVNGEVIERSPAEKAAFHDAALARYGEAIPAATRLLRWFLEDMATLAPEQARARLCSAAPLEIAE